ncbi:RTA1 like protein-domain-containing protein [Scheffersomyces amazonensis]|uniref:RTA1 like protein-domain-containing protein n=1 Tax=Scheffersomyces amazonensis TaxID=1078765 RepID=UPI00315CD8C7
MASTWSPTTTFVSRTALSSVDPTKLSDLQSVASAAALHLTSGVNRQNFVSYSRILRGAEASMTIIQAEDILATATDSEVIAQASEAIYDATLNIVDLRWNEIPYNVWSLVPAPNYIYLVIFALTFAYTMGMLYKSRFHWYNVAWSLGLVCELIGFIGRVLSIGDMTNSNYFLIQLICLTLAPAFLMGGIYFLFAQLVVIHGRQYSILKPLWYSYMFIGCDVLSLVIQAAGGAQASIASNNFENAKPGTDTMIAGIAFQVVSMSVFSIFWYSFLVKIYFKNGKSQDLENTGDRVYDITYKKASFLNFFRLLFNGKTAANYKVNHLDQFYNAKFHEMRIRKIYNFYPLAISIAVLCIYIRCVYRVVELAEGFDGYLITHEVYLMVLDAFMVAIAALIFVPFHPQLVLGDASQISLQDIKNRSDTSHHGEDEEEEGDAPIEGESKEYTGEELDDLQGSSSETVDIQVQAADVLEK